MDSRTLLLVLAVLLVNLLSRFYGFWVITRQDTPWKKGLSFWPAIVIQLLVPLPLPEEYPLLKWLLLSNTCLHVFKLIDYYHRYESLSEKDRNFRRFFHSFECLYTADIRKSFVKEAPSSGVGAGPAQDMADLQHAPAPSFWATARVDPTGAQALNHGLLYLV
ncbi:MAG: hypothetical protein ACK4WF_08625, partial [Candidatus Brocadiales bacterium]